MTCYRTVKVCLLAALAAGTLDTAHARPDQSTVTVTYIANEGVLLSDGTRKVVIDGLFERYGDPYLMPADSTHSALRSATGLFSEVDLLLVTHRHGDHFHPQPVLQHLRANSRASLVTSRQVVDSLSSMRRGGELAAQIVPYAVSPGVSHQTSVNGVSVHLIGVPHAGLPRSRSIEHVVYLVELGGKRFLHTGDADFGDDSWRSLRLDTARIDVAFIPQWVLRDAEGRKVVQERIAPRHIVGFHVTVGEEAETERNIRTVLPGTTVMSRSLQQWRW